ncbi:MAG: hypothetical protein ACRDHX_03620 [Chloroflexota bacterium]
MALLIIALSGACFAGGIVSNAGWLIAVGLVALASTVVLGLYGNSGHTAEQHATH